MPLVTAESTRLTREIRDTGSAEVLLRVTMDLINHMLTEIELNSLKKNTQPKDLPKLPSLFSYLVLAQVPPVPTKHL